MSELLNGKPAMASFRLPVHKFGVGCKTDVILRAEVVVALATHWLGGRTLLCADDTGFCPGCEHTTPRLSAFTLASLVSKQGRRLGLLEMTSSAALDLFGSLPRPLDGTILRCCRPGSRQALRFERIGRQQEMFGQPVEGFRLLQALATLFGVDLPRPGQTAVDWVESTAARRVVLLEAASRLV